MICVVTGANRGLGRDVVRQLAELGHSVYLTARSGPAAAEAAVQLSREATGSQDIRPWRLDVTEPETTHALRTEIEQSFGHLDVLVNNAAIMYDTWQTAATADLDSVREAFEVNLFGPWSLTQVLLPLLIAAQHPRVVNVSSGAGASDAGGSHTPAYRTTKTGLNTVTRMLAEELRGTGVLVNAVCPGWVATDMGGPGGRPVADGAAGIVWAATLDDSGPTGTFFRDRRAIPW